MVEPATLFLFGKKFLGYSVNGSPRNHFRGVFWVSNLTPPITSITNPRTKKGKSQERSISFEGCSNDLARCSNDFAGCSNQQRLSCFFSAIQVVCHHFNVYRCKMNSCLNLIVEVCQTLREFCKFAFSAVYLPSGFNSAPVFVPFLHSKAVISVQF